VMKNRWSIKNSPHAVRTLDDLNRTKGPAQAELGRCPSRVAKGGLGHPPAYIPDAPSRSCDTQESDV